MSIFDNFPNWRRAKEITIPGTYVPAGGITNVPVMVRFTNDADIGAICRADGYDIRFCDDSGTELSQYRLSFSVSNGQASGEFWVLLPSISQSGKTIYIMYGNSSASNVSNASVNPDILIDGDFEQWNSSTNLTNWDEWQQGSSIVNQESTQKTRGNYAVRLDVDASNNGVAINQSIWSKFIAGKKYLILLKGKASTVDKSAYLALLAKVGSNDVYYNFTNQDWSGNSKLIVLSDVFSLYSARYSGSLPEGTSNLIFTIIRGFAASSSLYFDDAHIFAGDTDAHCDFISASWYGQFTLTFGKVFSHGTISFGHTQTTNTSGQKGGRSSIEIMATSQIISNFGKKGGKGIINISSIHSTASAGRKENFGIIDIMQTIILSLFTKRIKRVYLKKESSISTTIVGKSRIIE